MKTIVTLLGSLLLMISLSQAQDFEENFESKGKKRLYYNSQWYQLMKSDDPNVLEVMKAYNDFFQGKKLEESLETREYKKWLRKIGTNFDAQGNLLKTTTNNADQGIVKTAASQLKSATSSWTSLGPDRVDMVAPMQSGHTTQGVVRSVAIHPTNSNIVLAASVSAGIWRSTDGGSTWNCVTNGLFVGFVDGIAFCENSPNVVYAASNSGALKSTDGGLSWHVTGLDWTAYYPSGGGPNNIVVDPNNPDRAYMASTWGVHITTNGGNSWTQMFNRETWDVEMHPSNSAVIYAAVSNGNDYWNRWVEFWRSDDYGETWTNVLQGYPTKGTNENMGRAEIAVSAAAPNNVWVVCPGGANIGSPNQVEGIHGIYKSTDSGVTFGHLCCGSEGVESNPSVAAPNMIDYDENGAGTNGGQYTWCMAFAVSDTDPDYMLIGGINVWKTTDGGATWSCVKRGHPQSSNTWTHYDIQGMAIKGNHSWITTDGGMHYSSDQCTTITNKSFGFVGIEVWGFDQGWKSDIMGIGMYHGPVEIRDDAIYDGWYVSSGADAGTVMVNKGDDQYLYARPWGNVKITRSTDRMTQPVIVDLGANCPSYLNPIETFQHRYYHTFYTFDGSKLLKTTNNAASWTEVKNFGSGYNVNRITTGFLNPDVVCVIVNWNTVYQSMDGGVNWTNITPSSTVSKGKSFSNITIDGADSNIIWVTMGGKQSDVKVLKTNNGGGSWTDYSGPAGNLPSYQINHIAHQIGTNGGVYIANSAGVWYRNNSMAEWQGFNNGLPLATDTWYIRLNYAKNKIRIGTLRGVWENELYENSSTVANAMVATKEVAVDVPVTFVDHSVALQDATYAWAFPGGTPAASTDEKPSVTYALAGTYDVSLTVSDAHGSNGRTFNGMVTTAVVQPAIDKTNWTLQFVDSEHSGNEATLAFDNNTTTYWHTQWSPTSPAYPHEIQIDLGESYSLEAFSCLPRQDGGQNGLIKEFEFYLSDDGANWGTAVKTGTWNSTAGLKKEFFAPTTGRYIRLVGLAEINGNAWASAAEIDVYGSADSGGSTGPKVSINYVDSEQAGEGAELAIDGNTNTFWHTQWSPTSPAYPHEVILDLGSDFMVSGFKYLPRQDGSQNGHVAGYEIYVSDNTRFNKRNKVASGTWTYSTAEKIVHFSDKAGRYVRFLATSEVNGNPWACAAELSAIVSSPVYTSLPESDQEQAEVQIYSRGRVIYLRHNLEVESTVQIFGVNGQMITQRHLSIYDREVNFMNATPGLYIVRLIADGKIITKKVMVK